GAALGSAERAFGRACRADRAARGRCPRGREGQRARRRGAAGDRLRPGRARGDRGAEAEGAASDRGGGLFAEAARTGAKTRRRYRGRSREIATVFDLGGACRDDAGAEGGAASATGAAAAAKT